MNAETKVAQNETNVGVGRSEASDKQKLIESERYQSMSVREQIEAISAVEAADDKDVSSVEASPEDYILGGESMDVETDESEASVREVVEARSAASQEPRKRCGVNVRSVKQQSSKVSTPEQIIGRTEGATYLVMGEGLPFGALIKFESIRPGASYEESTAIEGSALAKNDPEDVYVEARVTKVTGRDTMGITTEGDLDVEDTRNAEGVKTVRGPGQVFVADALLDVIPDDAKWFADF